MPHALIFRRQIENFRHDSAQMICHRPDAFLDDGIERVGRINHLARHQFAVPRGFTLVKNAAQEGEDERFESLLGGRIRSHIQQDGIFRQRLVLGVTQHFEIERFLVAEMIIDGGDVRAGAATDLADSRVVKTDFGKDFPSRFQQFLVRLSLA